MMSRSALFLFVTIFTHASALHAQKKLSLRDCYDQALRANLTLKQSRNNIESADIDLRNSKLNRLPGVSYNIDHYLSTGKNIAPVTNSFVRENFSGGFMGVSTELKIFSGFNNLYTIRHNRYN